MPVTHRVTRLALRPALLLCAAIVSAAPAVLSAQMPASASSTPPDPGFSFTPYVGMVMPTTALIGVGAGATQALKLSTAVTVGARLGISLGARVGLDGDVGYSPGSLEYDASGLKTNQDVQVTTASGRLTFYLIPRSSPVWLGVSGGAAAIRHSFSNSGVAATSAISAGTNVGGVIGASAGIRLGKLLAVSVGAEDYLYNASFDVSGVKTTERKQHDIRLSAGIRIPFLGI